MKTLFITIAMGLFSQPAVSAIFGHVVVEGIVLGYNKKTVTLSQRGHKTKVPRKNIPPFFKIEVGKKVHAVYDGRKIMEELKKLQEKEEQEKRHKRKPSANNSKTNPYYTDRV